MSTSAAPSHTASQNRDSFLCFCNQVTVDEFRARIAVDPLVPFENVCEGAGVGMKCTACLLNAENLFVEAVSALPSDLRTAKVSRKDRRFDKQALYDLIDHVSPMVSRRIPGIIPVLAGPGIRTVLTLANSVPPVIGSRAPAFEVDVMCRDDGGRTFHTSRHTIPPGDKLDLEISAGLLQGAKGGPLTTGGCWLHYRALGRGFIGGIRPHFKVETPVAVTAVHSAGSGHNQVYMETSRMNASETQFISAVNCEKRPVKIKVTVETPGLPEDVIEVTLPGFNSRLIEVPVALSSDRRGVRMSIIRATSDGEVRWHYAVVCGDPPRIALDHI